MIDQNIDGLPFARVKRARCFEEHPGLKPSAPQKVKVFSEMGIKLGMTFSPAQNIKNHLVKYDYKRIGRNTK
ncbi:hypothetical protein [Escherichia coli]|uniref:hypothetical protein n=1 Tax=Escherichia coli TaxID=562 RepID=UPI003B9D7428